MGYEFKDICYPTEPQATDAYYSSHTPISFNSTTDLIQYQYALVAGSWQFQKITIDSSGNATQQYLVNTVQTPTFRSCTDPNDHTANFTTGMELGSAVAGVMVIAYAIRRIYR